ncbi:hypothetical protein KR038_009889 [Drosophila bunnanda]|nr:hypothetical protein KR038_009889 [Drosophila bunnanda]
MALKNHYEEFIELTRNMKTEMDDDLEQKEQKIEELTTQAAIYERENEVLLARLNSQSDEMSCLRKELAAVVNKIEAMKVTLQILEHNNNHLAKARRIADEKRDTFEGLLFDECEKNAVLEAEVGRKRDLERQLQRQRNENMALRQELRKTGIKMGPFLTRYSRVGGVGGNSPESSRSEANLRQDPEFRQKARSPRMARNVRQFGSTSNEASEQHGGGSFASNLQSLIRKTVADMVSKLDKLQAKLRAHRVRRPLPSAHGY